MCGKGSCLCRKKEVVCEAFFRAGLGSDGAEGEARGFKEQFLHQLLLCPLTMSRRAVPSVPFVPLVPSSF